MIQVEGRPNLVKDPVSGAVINNDINSFLAAKAAKKRLLDEQKRTQELESRLSNLESIITELMKERV
jgi:hypothetical protein